MLARKSDYRILSKQYTSTATLGAGSRPAVGLIALRVTCGTPQPQTQLARHGLRTLCDPKPISSWSHCARSPNQGGTGHIRTMSSDDAYSSFLDQANQDTGASKVSSKSDTATTKAVNTEVPVGLQNVEQYYTSEADEPFEPVSLQWDGNNMPSESTFSGHDTVDAVLLY